MATKKEQRKLMQGVYDPRTGRTLDEGTYNPSIGRNLTLYESGISQAGEGANPQQETSPVWTTPTASSASTTTQSTNAFGGTGTYRSLTGSSSGSYSGDSGRPSYTPKYQSYIDTLLANSMQYGDYISPYQDRIDTALAGISGYGPYVSPYQDRIDNALEGVENYQPYSSPYADQIAAQWDAINNRDPFSYDLETDPAWQAYKKQYTREGRRASEDTLGQYAAMTGGMPSTAAMTAASQAADYYNAQMTDKIPELYKLAYSMYADEGNNLYNKLNALRGLESDDYGRYNDVYNRMLTGLNALQNADATEYGRYGDTYNRMLTDLDALRNMDATEYGRYIDTYNRNLQNLDAYRAAESDEYGRYRDTVGDWENDRAFNYNAEQDAWEQDYKQRAYEDSRADTAWEQEYKQKAYDDSRADTEWERAYAMGEVGPTIYAYGDGEPYEIGSGKGRSFVESAGAGQTMVGGDGSVWTKNDDGSTTITKNGSTWTVPAPAVKGRGGGGGGKTTTADDTLIDYDSDRGKTLVNASVGNPSLAKSYLTKYWDNLGYTERVALLQNAGYDDQTAISLAPRGGLNSADIGGYFESNEPTVSALAQDITKNVKSEKDATNYLQNNGVVATPLTQEQWAESSNKSVFNTYQDYLKAFVYDHMNGG